MVVRASRSNLAVSGSTSRPAAGRHRAAAGVSGSGVAKRAEEGRLSALPAEGVLILRHLLENGLFEGKEGLFAVVAGQLAAGFDGGYLGLNRGKSQRFAVDDPGSCFDDLLRRQCACAD